MAEDRDYEQEAREQGWKPKEEFTGPEDKWTDAQTFVEKGDKIAGILKSRLDRQEQEIRQLQNDNKQFGEYQKSLRDKDRARSAERIAELESQLAQAVNDGDGQQFTKLNREMQQVRDDMQVPVPTNGQDIDPLGQAWLLNNDWYNTNSKLQIYADGLAEQIINQGYTGPAYYTELSRRVKEGFPEEFQNKRQAQTNTVETGGTLETVDTSTHTYENLPPDAKAACDRFVESGLTTKEDYVATYEWEDE
jgi:hypothetical protein